VLVATPSEIFTFSILLIIDLFFIANFAAAFGLWLTVGYTVGDLLLFRDRLIDSDEFQ